MFWSLLIFATRLASDGGASLERAWTVAVAASDVAESEPEVFSGRDGVWRTAQLLVSVAYHESKFDPHAVGGLTQLRPIWWGGARCIDLRSSPEFAFRRTLAAIRSMQVSCGTDPMRWLGAYASGACGGAPVVARALCGPSCAERGQ